MKLSKLYHLGIVVIGLLAFTSCNKKAGCMDPKAKNYDADAKKYSECIYEIKNDSVVNPIEGVTFKVVFKAMANGKDFYLGEKYMNTDNRGFNSSALKFYVSNVKLAKNDEEKVLLKDVELINYDTTKPLNPDIPFWDNQFEVVVKALGTFNQVYLGCGVDIELNEEFSPNKYAPSHPLSTLYTGMGWAWKDKYKFAVLEGQIDSSRNGTYDGTYLYHTGHSDLYRLAMLKMDKDYEFKAGEKYELELIVDVPKIFDGVKMESSKENFSHTADDEQKAISEVLQTNLAKAISFSKITPM